MKKRVIGKRKGKRMRKRRKGITLVVREGLFVMGAMPSNCQALWKVSIYVLSCINVLCSLGICILSF